MADISLLTRLVNGVIRNVDISANTLVTTSIKVGGGSPSELTKAILDNLIALQNGTDFATGTGAHTHDGRYYTETELGSQADGASGASKIGIDVTPAFSNFTSGSTVQSALEGINTALGTAAGSTFLDGVFRIQNTATPTKQIAFDASAITAATTRTITMPDANVDLGNLTNSNISASAAIAYSKLNLSASIVNADIAAAAAIAMNKLAALTANRALQSDGSGFISASAVTNVELGYLSGVTSAIQTQLGNKANDADVIKKDGSVAFTADQSMGSFKLTNVSDPASAQDAATKAYVDSLIDGRDWKQSVKAATTAALTLASDFENGDSIDGVALVTNDRILIKDQASASENGIYIVQASGAPVRATDADAAGELVGAAVFVEQGTANADKQYAQTGDGATFAINSVWVVTSANSFSGHDMISLSGGAISVDLASDAGLESSNPGNAAGQLRVKLDGTTLSRSASGLKVAALGITNAEVSASAAIAYSKLNLSASIVNADIAAAAAIALNKLAALTANRALASDGSGFIVASAVTDTELGYLSGVTSAVQTQLGNKASTTLNNLGTTSINADLLPSADITRAIGSSTLRWLNLYATNLRSGPTGPRIDLSTGEMYDSSNVLSADFSNRELSVTGATKFNWSGSGITITSTGASDIVLVPGGNVNVSNKKIVSLLDPTAAQDAATKNYVDTLGKVSKSFVAGEAFAANTSFAVRIALTGETAGRVYKADYDASVSDKYYAYGMIEGSGAAAKIAGDAVIVVLMGSITLGSSDTAFAAGEVGQATHLLAAGAWDAVSQITYAANQASYRVGMVQEVSKILVGNMQLNGIA